MGSLIIGTKQLPMFCGGYQLYIMVGKRRKGSGPFIGPALLRSADRPIFITTQAIPKKVKGLYKKVQIDPLNSLLFFKENYRAHMPYIHSKYTVFSACEGLKPTSKEGVSHRVETLTGYLARLAANVADESALLNMRVLNQLHSGSVNVATEQKPVNLSYIHSVQAYANCPDSAHSSQKSWQLMELLYLLSEPVEPIMKKLKYHSHLFQNSVCMHNSHYLKNLQQIRVVRKEKLREAGLGHLFTHDIAIYDCPLFVNPVHSYYSTSMSFKNISDLRILR